MADLFSFIHVNEFIDTKFLQYSQASEMCDFCNVKRANFARECRAVVCSEMDRDQVERILVLYWCSICKEKWA